MLLMVKCSDAIPCNWIKTETVLSPVPACIVNMTQRKTTQTNMEQTDPVHF